MQKLGWDRGQDDEELFEFAMHESQYRDYKSGIAKERFNKDLQAAKEKEMQKSGVSMSLEDLEAFKHAKADAIMAPENGTVLFEVNGGSEGATSAAPAVGKVYKEGEHFCYVENQYGQMIDVPACLGGKLVQVCVGQGKVARKGSPIAYIERAQ